MACVLLGRTGVLLSLTLPQGRALRSRRKLDMEMKGNEDTFATVASGFYVHTKYVSVTTLEFTLSYPLNKVGHSPCVLLSDHHT